MNLPATPLHGQGLPPPSQPRAVSPHPPQRNQVQGSSGDSTFAQEPTIRGDLFHRPLRVKDALSYLGQVKQRVGLHSETHKQFLAIMRDFKMQAIDIPEVIRRIVSLFKEYPDLILGFNMFLPPMHNNGPAAPVQ